MRLYPYALTLLLPLPACGGEKCGDDSNCAPTSEGATLTDGTGGTSGSTAEPTTEAPTGTDATGPGTGTTDATTTTGTSTTATTATADGTTGEPGTGTTEGPPILGDPSTYGESCAPDDGQATEFKIKLAERLCDSDWPEDAPIFRIAVFKGVQLDVGEHALDGGWGFAYYDIGDGNPLNGNTGNITVTEVTADGLRGTYDVTLSDNTNLSGDFDALYCPVDVLCG